MNATTNAEHWCDLCHEYLSHDRPAALYHVNGVAVSRICLACLLAGVEACKREVGDSVVRGSRE